MIPFLNVISPVGKRVTSKQISNLKLHCPDEQHEQTELGRFKAKIEEQGGVFNVCYSEDKFVQVIFISTLKMKERLLRQRPKTIVLDTTFGTNIYSYKLCFKNAENGKTAIAAISLFELTIWSEKSFIASKSSIVLRYFLLTKTYIKPSC